MKQSQHGLKESIKPRTTHKSISALAPKLKLICDLKIAVEPKGNCFKQDKATFTHKNVVNIINMFIVYKLEKPARELNFDVTLDICFLELCS